MSAEFYASVVAALPLLMGYALDFMLGDPRWLPHPIVGFGKLIGATDRALNRGRARFWKGALSAVASIVGVYLACLLLERFAWRTHVALGVVFDALVIFFGLANRTLIDEGRAVFAALDRSLDEGRRRLSWIVGRDTARLNEQQVRTAVFETMAENLSDGVVAPLFWYAVLGAPGMMAYKIVNTLDSMIGHRTERHEQFGKAAARIDDVANWIPARLTAALMATLTWSARSWSYVWRFGSAHESPNSGYPEAALAGVLDLRFGGPHTYDGELVEKPWIGERARAIERGEIETVARLNHVVCAAAVIGCVVIGSIQKVQ